MAFQISRETNIDAPRDRVWAYISDFAKHPEWAEPKHQLRVTPPERTQPGATFRSVGKDMGRDSRNEVTITEVVPGSRLVYEAQQDDGTHWRNVLELSDAAGGTRIVKSDALISARFPMNVLFTVLGPIARAEGAKVFERDLQRIKSHVETNGAAVRS